MAHQFGGYGEIRWVGPPDGWFPGAQAVVSLRCGGGSLPPYDTLNLGRMTGDDPARVVENERRWTGALGIRDGIAKARLEHGVRCPAVEAPGLYGPADGLITRIPGLPLWITVADCYPLFIAAGSWIGLMHCGWRGTAEGAPGAIVEAIARASSSGPGQLRAWIGPGVGACCYPVGGDVGERFPSDLRVGKAAVHLDLAGAIRRALVLAGLHESAIATSGICTSCRPDLFFSYRRDGPASGRMAAVFRR